MSGFLDKPKAPVLADSFKYGGTAHAFRWRTDLEQFRSSTPYDL